MTALFHARPSQLIEESFSFLHLFSKVQSGCFKQGALRRKLENCNSACDDDDILLSNSDPSFPQGHVSLLPATRGLSWAGIWRTEIGVLSCYLPALEKGPFGGVFEPLFSPLYHGENIK